LIGQTAAIFPSAMSLPKDIFNLKTLAETRRPDRRMISCTNFSTLWNIMVIRFFNHIENIGT